MDDSLPRTDTPSSKETSLAAKELEVKRLELEARRAEAQQKLAAADTSWLKWLKQSSPTVLAALLTAALGLLGATLTAHSSLEVEKEKNKGALILQAISTSNPDTAMKNIEFLAKAKFFGETSQTVLDALPKESKNSPVLPVSSASSLHGSSLCFGRPAGSPCANGVGWCDGIGICSLTPPPEMTLPKNTK